MNYRGGRDGDWDPRDPRGPRDSGGYPRQGGASRRGAGGPGPGGLWGSDAPLPGEDYSSPQGTGSSPVRGGARDERRLPPRGGDAYPGQPPSGGAPRAPRDGRRDPRGSDGYARPDGRRDPRDGGSYPRDSYPQGGHPRDGYPRDGGESRDALGVRDARDPRNARDARDDRVLRDVRGPKDGRDPRQTGRSRMAGNDLPGGEFLPGFEDAGDWDYEDRRRGRRGRPAQAGGAPDPGGRRPGGQYPRDRYRDDRAVEDRYDEDRYVGEGYAGDSYDRDYDRDPYDRGSYDRDPYADDRPGGGHHRGEDGGGRLGAQGQGRGRPKRTRSRARRLAPWIALAVLLVFVVPLGGGGWYAYQYLQAKNHPPDYPGAGTGPQVMVQVMNGDTATSLAPRLVADGVVESDRAFVLAAEDSTSSAGLEAGFFLMNKQMKASVAYAYLLNPKDRIQKEITLPEGLRVIDTLRRLSAGSGIPLADFQAVLRNQLTQLALPPYAGNKPEGYLFPATYPVVPHESALAILQAMVNRFAQEAQTARLPASVSVPAHGGTITMSTAQLIIVASLVQAEGGHDADFPRIAEVIYNRLKLGMKLQLDSTVFYGLGVYGTSASSAQLAQPNPYSTYLHAGLPPGPIDSPGDAAIQATLHPATGNLVYFYGCPSGKTVFSPTTALTSSDC